MIKAVRALHSNDIFHRDIKLSNFVIDSDFNIKVIDFGYACWTNNEAFERKGTK